MKIEIVVDDRIGKALCGASALMRVTVSAIVHDSVSDTMVAMLKHVANSIKADKELDEKAKATGQAYSDLMNILE